MGAADLRLGCVDGARTGGERTSSIVWHCGAADSPDTPTVTGRIRAHHAAAVGGRLQLGIGVSHRVIVEDVWGLSFERPVQWARDYLAALVPTLNAGRRTWTAYDYGPKLPRPLDTFGTPSPAGVAGCTGPRDAALAGEHGRRHRDPHDRCADRGRARRSDDQGRGRGGRAPAPRIVVGLPTCVTPDVDAARRRCREEFAAYSNTPSYRAMLDREGAADPADVAADRFAQ
ncbi:LLM class flavin-dependent oxidoreductase [Rhodococcus hoagii]|nr:LLM class flavin-dependent oxidoreductase [Prescottella equi]